MEQEDLNQMADPMQPAWKNPPTLEMLKEDFTSAKNYADPAISKIYKWRDLKNITGSAKLKPIPGRSSIQPRLIRRQNEWRYSAMTEPFLSSKKMFTITPVTFKDKASAVQNELVLNHQFRTKMNSVKFIDAYVRKAVDDGTVIVRVGWCRETYEETQEVPIFEYSPVDPTDENYLSMLSDAQEMESTDPSSLVQLPDAIQKAHEYSKSVGAAHYARNTGETQLVQVTKVKRNHPTVTILEPENVFIDPSCEGDMEKARFAVISFSTSMAELKQDNRYINLDKINIASASSTINRQDHRSKTPDGFQFKDDARKRMVAYEYWGFWDMEGDGKLVPIVATWIDTVLIRLEVNPFPDEKIPLVFVPYLPIPNSVMGESDSELLEDNQKILGAISRSIIDMIGRSAAGQMGMAKGMLDPVNKSRFERGMDYEYNPQVHPSNGVIEHKHPELAQSVLQIMQLQNQEAEALTGVKAFSGGMSGNAYGDVAAGIRGMLDAAAKREMAILRRLAQGMKEIGMKVVAMNQTFMSEEEVVQITDEEFVTVTREAIQGNHDLQVDISTAEVDNAQAQDLGFMLQTMGPGMDFEIQKMIFAEIAKLKRLPHLAKKIEMYQPQPDPLEVEKKKLENALIQAQIDETKAKMERDLAEAKRASADADRKNLDFVEQETGTHHARQMELQSAQAQSNQDLAVTKSLVAPKKPEQKDGDLEAAIGFNELSKRNNNPSVNLNSNAYDPNTYPTMRPGMKM